MPAIFINIQKGEALSRSVRCWDTDGKETQFRVHAFHQEELNAESFRWIHASLA